MGTTDNAGVNLFEPHTVDRSEDWLRFERARINERRRFEERVIPTEAMPVEGHRGAA